jgi:hypothetical protein
MKFLKYSFVSVILIFFSLFVWGKIYSTTEPDLVRATRLADTIRIKNDLTFLTRECNFRNYHHLDSLNKAADYIKAKFQVISSKVEEQKYSFNSMKFRNLICSLGPDSGERIIIGAHYDVCNDQEGADDNASGVAGLLELARLLKDVSLKYRVDFVAYSLEEPPFFKSQYMRFYLTFSC